MSSDGRTQYWGIDESEESEVYEELTPDDLVRAARYGILENVEDLVYYGVDPNGLDKESKWTPLQIASFNGHIDVVKFLIECGAEVNKQWDSIGFKQWSAIHFASSRGHRDVVELLLSNGAGVNAREHEGKVPLHLACENGHVEVVKFLLANGATVHDRDLNGYTPLHWACLSGLQELVLTLLAHGARIGDRTESNSTALSAACSGGRHRIVITLLENGADVNDYDFPQCSPLYCASRRGYPLVVRTLLAHGAQVRGRDFSFWNPLHSACAGGHYKVVLILLNEGADVETYDEKGMRPIQNVCNGICRSQYVPHLQMSDKAYTLKILLEYGIDPGALDKEGLTTFERVRKDEWSLYSFDNDLLAILLDYGVGTGVVCRVDKCSCNSTALMCWYLFFRLLFTVTEEARESVQPLIDTFEQYFIKTKIVGMYPCNEEKAYEPSEEVVDWNQSKREAFRAECEAELSRMTTDTIGNTSATYFSLLTRDMPALRHQNLFGQLTGDGCAQRYPIYGNIVYYSYTRLRRLFLEEVSPGFFAIFSPPLLPECAEAVQRYLSTKELENIVEVYRAYLIYLDKVS